MNIYKEKTLEKDFDLMTTHIKTSGNPKSGYSFTFLAIIEKISSALNFLKSADVGPWIYK